MSEQWKTITIHDGAFSRYEVSDMGRVKSFCGRKPRLLRIKEHQGRDRVDLTPVPFDKVHSFTVHSLVANEFLGKRPDGLDVHHIDHNPKNNRASNLIYTTRKGNMQEYMRHQDRVDYPSDEAILKAMKRIESGEDFMKVAKGLGFSRKKMSRYVAGETREHLFARRLEATGLTAKEYQRLCFSKVDYEKSQSDKALKMYYGGKTYEEIAAFLKSSEKAARAFVNRERYKLGLNPRERKAA